MPPHDLRPLLADAKIVSGELDRGSRTLEAEVESRENMPDAAVAALEQLLQEHYGFRQVRLRFVSAAGKKSAELWQAHQRQARLHGGTEPQNGRRCGGGLGVFCRLP